MSQDPLRTIRRRDARERTTFPDPLYRALILEPFNTWSDATLGGYAREIWLAHAVVLTEAHALDEQRAREAVAALLRAPCDPAEHSDLYHALRAVEQHALSSADGVLRLGTAHEEIVAATTRMLVRDRSLGLHEHACVLREELVKLASQHLNTLVVITSNGQSVQPTSLGHYLLGLVGPLRRVVQRMQQAYERVNQSPIGAVAGASSAVPVLRERSAELLGFDGVVENTLDAVASTDSLEEIASILGTLATAISGFVADLGVWARDDVGTLLPGQGFVHAGTGQPQRIDPTILDHLRTMLVALMALPSTLTPILAHRQMLGGVAGRIGSVQHVAQGAELGVELLRIASVLVSTLDVNRAMLANRTNRGFSTSSELADLLAIDLKLPPDQAYELTERVVAEALLAGHDATMLRTELIDGVALQMIGRELGIEPELLSRCLAPRRFIERRDVFGGPAPPAVSASLQRESFANRRDQAWAREARERIESARNVLRTRAEEIAGPSQSP